jgi:hypothetical protein
MLHTHAAFIRTTNQAPTPTPTPIYTHRNLVHCRTNHPLTPEHQQPPQSSRTSAWFTAAPAPTRALTTSTRPWSLAAYSGVTPSVCQTTDTGTQPMIMAHTASRMGAYSSKAMHNPHTHTHARRATHTRCNLTTDNPRITEFKHHAQSSHTSAWFTAAPAPTRTLTTST